MPAASAQTVPAEHGAVYDVRLQQLAPDASQRFVRFFLQWILLALAAIAALNFLVNPQAIYPTRLLAPLTWNARAVKEQLLSRYGKLPAEHRPQVLVLGSSRVMKLDPASVQQLTGMMAFNAGVNAAMAEDNYALLRHAIENCNLTPRLVLIGVDGESFHDHVPVNDYLQQPNALGRFLRAGSRPAARWKEFTSLFTLYQTQNSLLSLYLQLGGRKPQAVDFRPDGFPRADVIEGILASGHFSFQENLRRTAARYATLYGNYSRLSPERLAYFEQTLAYLRDRQIPAVVFVTPTHPQLTATLARYGYAQRVSEVAQATRHLSEKYGADFRDYSSIAALGLGANGFWDGVHMSQANAQRLTDALLSKAPAANAAAFRAGETHALQ